MRKIAIIGAGFSGLGLCYHLLQKNCEVTLFDSKGIGGGASGIASGLLHPYLGESAKLSWRGKEAMRETTLLLTIAGHILGQEVASTNGILRLALSEKQKKAFQKQVEMEEDVAWWNIEKCQVQIRGVSHCPGIFIRSGQTVYARLYLKGLWEVCKQLGAQFERQEIASTSLEDFHHVVLTAGSGIRNFKECMQLHVKYNKGQLLVCEKPSYFDPKCSLIGRGYLALSEKNNLCYIGSTYEHQFLTDAPCMGVATQEIFSRVGQFLPSYGSFFVYECLSGIRVSSQKTCLPCAGRLKKHLWVLTAMGSRGLLYHGLMGKYLAAAIFAEDETVIPQEVRI